MRINTLGAGALARLMREEDRREAVFDWLLFGPTDPQTVAAGEDEPEARVPPLAAE